MDIQDATTWRVLIVDDEPDNLELVSDALLFFGATIELATNGQECLARLTDFQPSFILLDLSMPVMDGWETRSKIHGMADYADLPIIALTAHAMVGDRQRALAAGFNGYLTKPVDLPHLLRDLQTILEG